MIRLASELPVQAIEHMKGGTGQFVLEHILSAEEMHGKGRLFARGTLAPGDSVGYHVHEGDMEVCYFLSGSGTVREEDGTVTAVSAGDCNIVDAGHAHEIVNTGSEDLVYIALILFV